MNNHHVNDKLRMQRKLRKWTRQDVADKIGASHISIVRWEKGQRPNDYYRRELCRLFGKNEEELGISDSDFYSSQRENSSPQELHQLAQEQEVTFSLHLLDDPARPPLSANGHHLIGRDSLLYQFKQQLYDPVIPSLFDQERPLIGRSDEFQLLKRRLVTQTGSLAIYGLPGIGKTALVTALVHDYEVCECFRDGILWVGLGREPNVLRLLSRWAILLGLLPSEVAKLSNPELLASAIRDLIGLHRTLLIIDDAWEIEAAQHFKIGGSQCTYLMTTRFPPVALQFARDKAISIHELSEDDGLALLKSLASEVVTEEANEVRELVRSVGGLPLALTLMGKYLQVQAHDRQPRRIRMALERLSHVDTRLRLTEAQDLSERSPSLPIGTPLSLQAAIEVSDQQLDYQTQESLRALSVFPAKPNNFSEKAALMVCGLSEEGLDRLTDAGLLESYSAGRYTLHQTIADYAKLRRTDNLVEEKMVLFFVSFLATYQCDYEQIELELSNILAAFEIAASKEMSAALQQGVTLLAPFLESKGLYALAERYLNQAKQAALSSDDKGGLALI